MPKDEDTVETQEATEEPQPTGPNWKAIGIIGGAAVLGLATGGFVVAPAIRGGGDEAMQERPAAHAAEEPPPVGEVLELENIIVNPARSDGLRFLIATVAIEVPTEHQVEELRERSFQLRDGVTSVLETRTLEQLTSPGARDMLRALLEEVISPYVEHGVPFRVYIPHYVIQ